MTPKATDLPAISDAIWRRKYRFSGAPEVPADQTLQDTFRRVANAAAATEKGGKRARNKWASAFYDSMADFGFQPAGRIIAGAGTHRNVTLFNCFVLGKIEDDLSSIFESVQEAALTMQAGGGIGHDFSTLRPRGAAVKSIGADASGPISFMDVWDAMCRTIMSAGQRRGAMMATMRCDHPDIEDFVSVKSDPSRLRNFNLSVLVNDAFMDAVDRGTAWELTFEGHVYKTIDARALWDKIMRATYDYAEPGVIFIDRVNEQNNLAYCETISATNPCVPGDTWVQTSSGPRLVSELIGRPFRARVNGDGYMSGPDGFFCTGTKPLVRLKTAEGYSLRLTADHRVTRVTQLNRHEMQTEWCAAGDLRPGDRVLLNNHRAQPAWDGNYSAEQGYLLGLLVGDGTLKSDKATLSVWRPAAVVNAVDAVGVDGVMAEALRAAATLSHRSDFAGWHEIVGRNEFRLSLGALKTLATELGMSPGNKIVTPVLERGSSVFYQGFLRGFFDADGSVQGTQPKGVSIRLAQSDLPRLEAVQRMLLRLGIVSTLYRNRRGAGVTSLPDGTGGRAIYPTQAQHELVISGDNLVAFGDFVGFADYEKAARLRLAINGYRRALNRERFVARVSSVSEAGTEDVYDVSIPGLNAFDANGFVAHNCGEQPLPPYGACLLGSINLARLVEKPFTSDAYIDIAKLEARVAIAVRFLDNVIDISRYPLEAQKREALAKRRIGLGVTGLADALIFLGLPYGSAKARETAAHWLSRIQNAAYRASADLAAEKGAFPLYDADAFLSRPNIARLDNDVQDVVRANGIRNGCLTSIAPTGTISLLAGNVSSGVEPVFDFVYRRRVLDDRQTAEQQTVEDYAHRIFRETFGDAAVLPDAFVTAEDLTPADHVAMQAALQPFVDSAISKTVNCPEGISFESFRDIYKRAFDLGLKGCTTYRPNPVTGAVLTRDTVPVQSAESPVPAVADVRKPATQPVAAETGAAGVVYMTKPLERDAALDGVTYKIKWPASAHALYVTINDIVRDGRRRPFEVFINTKNLEHYAWTVALTRMISAVFRRGGDVAFVAEELKAVFDPEGGRWMDGRYVPSLLAAIGDVIEKHMLRTGFLTHGGEADEAKPDNVKLLATVTPNARASRPPHDGRIESETPHTAPITGARVCPRCGDRALRRIEGCWTCASCTYSRCG